MLQSLPDGVLHAAAGMGALLVLAYHCATRRQCMANALQGNATATPRLVLVDSSGSLGGATLMQQAG